MSRKYNNEQRLLNAYNRYIEQFGKRMAAWISKGHAPVDPLALSYEDYKANRTYLKAKGVAPGNVTRTLISSQLYEYSQSQAKEIVEELKSIGITDIDNRKVTIEAVKAGLGSKALSLLNDKLKAKYVHGFDRATYISNVIFGSE